MNWIHRHLPQIIGGALGLAFTGYVFVYAPMRSNYERCGRVTLCDDDLARARGQ